VNQQDLIEADGALAGDPIGSSVNILLNSLDSTLIYGVSRNLQETLFLILDIANQEYFSPGF
jgi:hypothetical protein